MVSDSRALLHYIKILSNVPLMRLLRWTSPAGAGLLFLPCLWGLTAAAEGFPSLYLMLLFGIGAFLTRSAGCIYNDWVDQDFDRQVCRTRSRPLAERSVSPKQAFFSVVILLGVSLGVLLQFNRSSILAGFFFAALVPVYPWLKRVTFWPQIYLGFLFSSGVWVGWFAVRPQLMELSPVPFLLYVIGILWTLSYDTLYAYQDYTDDRRIGLKSSAVRLGKRPLLFFCVCWSSILIFLVILGLLCHFGWCYGIGLLLIGAHFVWQAKILSLSDPVPYFHLFKANQGVGLLIFLSLLAGYSV